MNELLNITAAPQPAPSPRKTPQPAAEKGDKDFKSLMGEAIKRPTSAKPKITEPVEGDLSAAAQYAIVIPADTRPAEQTVQPIVLPIADLSPIIAADSLIQPSGQPADILDLQPVETLPTGQAKAEMLHLAETKPIDIEQPIENFVENGIAAPKEAPVLGKEPAKAESAVQRSEQTKAESPLSPTETIKPKDEERTADIPVDNLSPAGAGVTAQTSIREITRAPQEVKAESNDFPVKMAEAIFNSHEIGTAKTFEVSLYPKELGKVTINVSVEAGKAIISLVCESQKAQTLLNTHADAIRSIVESSTGFTATTDVKQTEQEAGGQRNDFEGHNPRQHADNGRQNRRENREETSSFIQRLRLGLIEAS